jgi:hypothetical protein
VIRIYTLKDGSCQVNFDPEEPVWQFSARVAGALPNGWSDENRITNRYALIYTESGTQQIVNTFSNRMGRVGDIITNPQSGLTAHVWHLAGHIMGGGTVVFVGNSSPMGTDREVCAICLEVNSSNINDPNNPLRPVALRCGHVFHRECIQDPRVFQCPACRGPT